MFRLMIAGTDYPQVNHERNAFSRKDFPPVYIYKVISKRVEASYGARFILDQSQVEAGALCLWRVGMTLFIGRECGGWICQPSRWIYVGSAIAKCLGRVVLLIAM